MKGIGERIKLIRKSRNITQAKFSKELGISQAYVSKLEKDKENPSDLLLNFIAYRYCVNLEWLKTGQGTIDNAPGLAKENCINSLHMYSYELENLYNEINDDQIFNITNSLWCFVSIIRQICNNENMKPNQKCEFIKSIDDIYRYLWAIISNICTKNDNEIYSRINSTMIEMQKMLTHLYMLLQ